MYVLNQIFAVDIHFYSLKFCTLNPDFNYLLSVDIYSRYQLFPTDHSFLLNIFLNDISGDIWYRYQLPDSQCISGIGIILSTQRMINFKIDVWIRYQYL